MSIRRFAAPPPTVRTERNGGSAQPGEQAMGALLDLGNPFQQALVQHDLIRRQRLRVEGEGRVGHREPLARLGQRMPVQPGWPVRAAEAATSLMRAEVK